MLIAMIHSLHTSLLPCLCERSWPIQLGCWTWERWCSSTFVFICPSSISHASTSQRFVQPFAFRVESNHTCLLAVQEFIFGHSWSATDWVQDGLTKWRENFFADWENAIRIWGPSDCIQFAIPIWMRMPFRHVVSFFWTAYVSFLRAG